MKQTSRMRVGVGLAVLVVAGASLTACGGDGNAGRGRDDPAGQRLRQLRLRGPLRPVREGPPRRQDRRDRRGRPRAVQHAAHPEDRGRQRCRRRGRDRGGPGRQLPAERRQVRELPGPRLQRPEGPVAGLEVRPGHHRRRRPHHRARHRRRRPGHVLPHATCSSRPGCPPTATRSARCGRRGTTSSPPASSSRQGIGDDDVHFIDSATNTYNSILMQSRRPHLLRHRRQPRHRQQPGGQGGLGPAR